MAVVKVGSFAPGDEDLNNLMENTNLQAIGNDKVTVNVSTNVVNAGSVFECGGAYYEVTGNTAISGTKTNPVHVYFNPINDTFSYSTTVPTYNNALQGYYSSTSKCLMRGDTTGVQPLVYSQSKIAEKIYTGTSLDVESGGIVNVKYGGDINVYGEINVASGGEINANNSSNINLDNSSNINLDSSSNINLNNSSDINLDSSSDINLYGTMNVESGAKLTCKSGSTASFSGSAGFFGTMRIPTGTSAPSSPSAGTMYFDTSTNRIYIYNGSAWRYAVTAV